MKNPKPVSEKTMQKAKEFLGEYNLTAEQLSESQKECLIKFVREKRVLKWAVLSSAVCIIIFIAICFYYVPAVKSIVGDLMKYSVKITDKGMEKYIRMDGEGIESLKIYGLECERMGFGFGVLIVTFFLGQVAGIVFSILYLRDKKEIFEAFLPPVKAAPQ